MYTVRILRSDNHSLYSKQIKHTCFSHKVESDESFIEHVVDWCVFHPRVLGLKLERWLMSVDEIIWAFRSKRNGGKDLAYQEMVSVEIGAFYSTVHVPKHEFFCCLKDKNRMDACKLLLF